jgi:Tfp pilus assembly protein PilE
MKIWKHKGWNLAEATVAVILLGIFASMSFPNYIRMKERAWEAGTKGNAHTVQLAAEVYAIQHFGNYAEDATDLQVLLPQGNALTNHYNGEPVVYDGSAGDMTYHQNVPGKDYTITAFGCGSGGTPRVLMELTN